MDEDALGICNLHIYSGVGYCIVYFLRVRHNLLADKRNQLHTFLFLLSSRRGQVTLFGIVMFKLTLHEAIASVLESHNRPLSANELADEINSRRLNVRKDGALLRSGQIHARVNKYPHLFIKDENGGITLK